MGLTYKQIADICGVSRATVDRVVHNRGKVKPEVERRVRAAIEEYNFRPNQVGRALALARNPVKIGVLVHLTRIDFFHVVLDGVHAAEREITALGGEILLREQQGFDAEEQICIVNEMVEQGVRGIALTPAQSVQLRDRLTELSRAGIPVVTFNTELNGLQPLGHVGVDIVQGGRLAAHLMDLLLRGRGGKVLLISGYLTQQSNYQRVDGFVSECGERYPGMEVMGLRLNADDAQAAYEITREVVENVPDLAGIYMVSSGQAGACRALEDSGFAGRIQMVTHDLLPSTRPYVERGVIQMLINQDAYVQGNLPPKILADYLSGGKLPSKQRDIGKLGVITRYNL